MKVWFFEAFRFYDECGLPLSVQSDCAKMHGVELNLAAFACDAFLAGWSEEKVERTLLEVRADLDWKEFRLRLVQLWFTNGKRPDPECWPAMKKQLMEHSLNSYVWILDETKTKIIGKRYAPVAV